MEEKNQVKVKIKIMTIVAIVLIVATIMIAIIFICKNNVISIPNHNIINIQNEVNSIANYNTVNGQNSVNLEANNNTIKDQTITNDNSVNTQNNTENSNKIINPFIEETSENIEFKEYSIEYYLKNDDIGFLTTTLNEPTKYEIFNNYSDYESCYNTIDSWAKDIIEEYSKNISDRIDRAVAENPKSFADPKKYKEELIEDYKKSVEEKVAKIKEGFEEGDYSKEFFDNNNLVIIEHSVYNRVLQKIELDSIKKSNSNLDININTEEAGVVAGGQCRLFFIAIPNMYMKNISKINVIVNSKNTSIPGVAYKPIIYLYPTEDTDVSIRLLNSNNLTCSYPKYIDRWSVTAKSDGVLLDKTTGRKLYSLYYESENVIDFKVEEEGFVVKGEDSINFLEEKLAILGLTETEAEEFIIYWLPKLENNKYNYIRFATIDEINKNMPLEILPNPDTVIRVLMTYKRLENPINVKEQELTTPERTGFVAVEWGGTDIK